MPPVVSVVMSVYNGQPYLHAAIKSILEQTYTDYEFIIIDDASTDQSKEIIESFDDSRICLLENSENLGLTRSLNRGLGAARGTFVARMDADDISLTGRFMAQVEALQRSEAKIAFPRVKKIDTCSGKTFEVTEIPWGLTRWRSLFANAYGNHSSVMFERLDVWELGGYDHKYAYTQDYELWDRCVNNGFQFIYIPKILNCYYLRSNSISRHHWEKQDQFARKVSYRALRRFLPGLTDQESLGLRWLFLPWEHQVSQDVIADGLKYAPTLLDAFMEGCPHDRQLVWGEAAASIAYRVASMGASNRRLGYTLMGRCLKQSGQIQTLIKIAKKWGSGWLNRNRSTDLVNHP